LPKSIQKSPQVQILKNEYCGEQSIDDDFTVLVEKQLKEQKLHDDELDHKE
jgi:hypothetical protein